MVMIILDVPPKINNRLVKLQHELEFKHKTELIRYIFAEATGLNEERKEKLNSKEKW